MLIQPAPSIRQSQPEVTLLTSAMPLPSEVRDYDRWRSGLGHRSSVAVTADARAECATGDIAARNETLPSAEFQPFDAIAVHGCEGTVDVAAYQREVEAALADKTAWMAARELWTGTETGNPSLQSTATDIGGTGDPTNVVAHLIANYEDATLGGQAFVHLPSTALPALTTSGFVERTGNRLLTPNGHVVIPGPGYPNAAGSWGPDGSSASATGELWVFVSGPVEVGLGAPYVYDVGRGVAARQNLVELYARRPVIVRFDTDIVFAALATVETLT